MWLFREYKENPKSKHANPLSLTSNTFLFSFHCGWRKEGGGGVGEDCLGESGESVAVLSEGEDRSARRVDR